MALTPFTPEDAAEVCEDFEDLIDTEFKIGTSPVLLIESVAVSPFRDEDKRIFTENYYTTKDNANAIGFYSGHEYDVILITSDPEIEDSYGYMDIRTFAELRGIKYSFPETDV